ncbi:M28 family metallopeptidase [soil metagenome]
MNNISHFSVKILCAIFLVFTVNTLSAQSHRDSVIAAIIREATENSQLENLAHELLDQIGPRLVGSPKMQQAHDWAVDKDKTWDIPARNEKWGQWRGWERGTTHIDMVSPWIKSLEGTQLAWSPSTKGKALTAEVIILPDINDSIVFRQWLPSVKGKYVMTSMLQPTGRPMYNWEEFGTKASVEKIKNLKDSLEKAWVARIKATGFTSATLPGALEKAGAAGIISSYWSAGFGVDKIFDADTRTIPSLDIALEDYGLLYRLILSGNKPRLSIYADSRETGMQPTYNTLAEIRSPINEKEIVMLSAHFDSWDGATGATDNGTGTITMLEAMRILKKVYPNPRRTIMVGHWGGEEQGLNGSRAFVEDHPEIINKIQAVFNQDNGTGRVVSITGQGFLHAYQYIGKWLFPVPSDIKSQIIMSFPGEPATGGSDYASFVAAGVPAFSLSSNSWLYETYTWHTNRDTYDKIVFDDVRNNVMLTAILAYMACEDPEKTSREKASLPIDQKTGEPAAWPQQKSPTRIGGVRK